MATLKERALKAHRQAEQERLKDWARILGEHFTQKWGVAPDTVQASQDFCEIDGMLLQFALTGYDGGSYWRLAYVCPDCGEIVLSRTMFHSIEGLGEALHEAPRS